MEQKKPPVQQLSPSMLIFHVQDISNHESLQMEEESDRYPIDGMQILQQKGCKGEMDKTDSLIKKILAL